MTMLDRVRGLSLWLAGWVEALESLTDHIERLAKVAERLARVGKRFARLGASVIVIVIVIALRFWGIF
jgi:hypothetical protein